MNSLAKTVDKVRHKVKPLFPLFFLALVLIPFHILIDFYADDLYFLRRNFDLAFFIGRYHTWSSRLFIDFVVMLFVRCFWLWKIANVFVFLLLAFVLQKMFAKSEIEKWFVVALILLYPIFQVGSAGWVATTLNYLWPLTFGLVGIYPAIKIYRKERIRYFEYPIYMISLLYGANQELMGMAIFAVYAVAIAILLKRDGPGKKIVFPVVQFLLASASIVFILTAPGNAVRYNLEINRFFLGYEMLSIPRKLSLGFSRTLSEVFFNVNALFLLLCLFACLLVWLRHREWLARGVAMIPLIVSLVFGSNATGRTGEHFDKFVAVANRTYGVLDVTNYHSRMAFLCFMVLGIAIICLGISLFLAFRNPSDAGVAVGIFALGLGISTSMAFSPTVWASNDRTHIFLYYAVICAILLMFRECRRMGYKMRTAVGLTVVTSFVLFLFNYATLLMNAYL